MLLRKMFRDMMENKLAYVACISVMSLGLMIYASMNIVMVNLIQAKDQFYSDYQMADVFVEVQSIPNTQIENLTRLDGVEKAQGVIKEDFRVDLDLDENVYLRLNSYDLDESDRINDVYLSQGFELNASDHLIWIGEKFITEHGLSLGDTIPLIVNGQKLDFTVAGAVQSPEYVYVTRNAYDIMPSPKTFDIVYVSKPIMEELIATPNRSNRINITLSDGYTFDDVKPLLETALSDYGVISILSVDDQSSNVFLEEELKGLISMSQSMPFLFLGISSFILYIMLKRLTETQRSQIGILKAMGYRKWEIFMHYLSYAFFIGVLSGIVGGFLGTQLSMFYTELYKEFFSFPTLKNSYTYTYFVFGIFLAVGFSLFAGYQGTKKVLRLTPSQAMSPPAPKSVSRVWIEKITPIWELFTMQGKMALRNLARSKGRSVFTVLGLVFAFSMMVVSWSYDSLIDTMLFDQFDKVQLYDMKVTLQGIQSASDIKNALYHIDGVNYVETLVEFPVQLRFGTAEKSTIIMSLDDDSTLYNILDSDQHRVPLTEDGLYLSQNLAVQMGISEGDVVRVESPYEGADIHYMMPVVKIIPQYLGSNGYVRSDYFQSLTGYDNLATSALVNIDAGKANSIRQSLDDAVSVGVIEFKAQTLQKYIDMLDSYGFMSYILALVSIIIGFAIVYNSSIISLSERQRELASLRVLGMSVGEVLQIVSIEQWILGAVSIVLGIPLAKVMMEGLSASYQTDIYAMPPTIGDFAFILSVFGTALFIVLSQLNVKRRIRKIDIVEVLKERD